MQRTESLACEQQQLSVAAKLLRISVAIAALLLNRELYNSMFTLNVFANFLVLLRHKFENRGD